MLHDRVLEEARVEERVHEERQENRYAAAGVDDVIRRVRSLRDEEIGRQGFELYLDGDRGGVERG